VWLSRSDPRGRLSRPRPPRSGGRAKLSREQLEFVGVVARRRDPSGGWHQPDELVPLQPLYEVDAEPSTEDTAISRR
jgi:transposase